MTRVHQRIVAQRHSYRRRHGDGTSRLRLQQPPVLHPARCGCGQPSTSAASRGRRRGRRQSTEAPGLVVTTNDASQVRGAQRQCRRHVTLSRHTLPSPQAVATAALAGMHWNRHSQALIVPHVEGRLLVELMPNTRLNVPRFTSRAVRMRRVNLTNHGSPAVLAAAGAALLRPDARR